MEADLANTLIEQGILGLWCMFMIFLYHQGNKRAERIEQQRERDRKDADERLDELISKVDTIIVRLEGFTSRFDEKLQEDKMQRMIREASRGRAKTEIKPRDA
jgi:C4-dicarboxylate-specific signal transduction histidine kinase|tara:strand:+ start:720 stop:1028 length:309 start_codon:yes stop_codon:yes gene_type:complete